MDHDKMKMPGVPPLAYQQDAQPVPVDPVLNAVMGTVREVNKAIGVRHNEPPEFRFMAISDNLTETILQNAQAQLNKAENNLKLAEQMVQDIKEKSKRIWEVLQEFEHDLEDYGEATLSVHQRFMRSKPGNSK